ncbi:MAG: hypothetical protein ABGX43_05630 [Nitrospinaceae bacterium]
MLIFQFDQSDLLLPSAEYYQAGFGHPVIQAYYDVLLNVATLLGADPVRAKTEMKELIEFEMNLASVSIVCVVSKTHPNSYKVYKIGISDYDPTSREEKLFRNL